MSSFIYSLSEHEIVPPVLGHYLFVLAISICPAPLARHSTDAISSSLLMTRNVASSPYLSNAMPAVSAAKCQASMVNIRPMIDIARNSQNCLPILIGIFAFLGWILALCWGALVACMVFLWGLLVACFPMIIQIVMFLIRAIIWICVQLFRIFVLVARFAIRFAMPFFRMLLRGIIWLARIAWRGITWLARTVWRGITWLARTVWRGITWLVRTVWRGITWLARTVWRGITWLARTGWRGIKWCFDKIMRLFRRAPSSAPASRGIGTTGSAATTRAATASGGTALLSSPNEAQAPVIRNKELIGNTHPKTGIPYKPVEKVVNGQTVVLSEPQFNSKSKIALPKEMYKASDAEQFRYANENLKSQIVKNPDLEKSFSKRQMEQIQGGDTPEGYTWHHSGETDGELQLVESQIHAESGHTGGRQTWGGGSENR
jgi:hypothetical protein